MCSNLKEGDYFLFTQMPLNELNKSYNVTVYGVAKCGFDIVQNNSVLKETCKYIINKSIDKDVKVRQLENISKGLDSNDSGKVTRTLVEVGG